MCGGLAAIPTGTISMSVDVGWRKYYNLHQSVNRTSKNPSRRTSSVLVDGTDLQETGRADDQSKTGDIIVFLYVKDVQARPTVHSHSARNEHVSSCLSDELQNPGGITRSLLKELHSHIYVLFHIPPEAHLTQKPTQYSEEPVQISSI